MLACSYIDHLELKLINYMYKKLQLEQGLFHSLNQSIQTCRFINLASSEAQISIKIFHFYSKIQSLPLKFNAHIKFQI